MRVGAIPYLNALPLLHGLPWEFQTEPPAVLQASLLAGRFDLALCSITTALCHEGFFIVPGMGIGCRGAVASVRLVLHDGHTDVRQCRRIALDPESNTANLLLRVLLRCKYDLHEVECIVPKNGTNDVDAHLVIGDRALMEDNQPHSGGEGGPRLALPGGGATRAPVIDLGAIWSEWTGAPFVFAAWLVRTPTIAEAMVTQLTATRERNLAQLDTLIAAMPAVGALLRDFYSRTCGVEGEAPAALPTEGATRAPVIDRLAYLRHNISYVMDTEAVRGMQRFHTHLIALGLAPDRPLPFAQVAGC